jgi:hypothetical protein
MYVWKYVTTGKDYSTLDYTTFIRLNCIRFKFSVDFQPYVLILSVGCCPYIP